MGAFLSCSRRDMSRASPERPRAIDCAGLQGFQSTHLPPTSTGFDTPGSDRQSGGSTLAVGAEVQKRGSFEEVIRRRGLSDIESMCIGELTKMWSHAEMPWPGQTRDDFVKQARRIIEGECLAKSRELHWENLTLERTAVGTFTAPIIVSAGRGAVSFISKRRPTTIQEPPHGAPERYSGFHGFGLDNEVVPPPLLVMFHHDDDSEKRGPPGWCWEQLVEGNLMSIANPKLHRFRDGSIGFRVEDLSMISITTADSSRAPSKGAFIPVVFLENNLEGRNFTEWNEKRCEALLAAIRQSDIEQAMAMIQAMADNKERAAATAEIARLIMLRTDSKFWKELLGENQEIGAHLVILVTDSHAGLDAKRKLWKDLQLCQLIGRAASRGVYYWIHALEGVLLGAPPTVIDAVLNLDGEELCRRMANHVAGIVNMLAEMSIDEMHNHFACEDQARASIRFDLVFSASLALQNVQYMLGTPHGKAIVRAAAAQTVLRECVLKLGARAVEFPQPAMGVAISLIGTMTELVAALPPDEPLHRRTMDKELQTTCHSICMKTGIFLNSQRSPGLDPESRKNLQDLIDAADGLVCNVQLVQICEDVDHNIGLSPGNLSEQAHADRVMVKERESLLGSRCCAMCGQEEKVSKFQQCAGCKLVRYCSKLCQRQHWQSHKTDCRAFVAHP